jgi:hypothetical protein
MKLYHCDNSNLCLVKDEERRLYTLAIYDNDTSRRIIWNQDKHKALTEFVDKIFK